MAEYQRLSRPDLASVLSHLKGGDSPSGGGKYDDRLADQPHHDRLEMMKVNKPWPPIRDGGMPGASPTGGMQTTEDAPIQQLAQYLYQLGENSQALNEDIEGMPPSTGGNPGPAGNDGTDGVEGLPGRDASDYYPWQYGLLYDNRNENSAVTSGGGAWVAETESTDLLFRQSPANDVQLAA